MGGRPLAVSLLLACALLAPGAQAAARLPAGFFGVVPQGPLSAGDLERMEGVVGTVRVSVDWASLEPQPGSFEPGALDELMVAASGDGIEVLPVLAGVPPWLRGRPARSPVATKRGRAEWKRFVRFLAQRYGPNGSLWRERGLAPRPPPAWQIGNEPNFALYWKPWPSPREYATELRIAAGVLREEDPSARIVLAGLAPVNAGPRPEAFLRSLYRLPGVRRDFDAVALHPYSWTLEQLRYQIVQVRRVMTRAGDAGKPLLVSEIGVASGSPFPTPFDLGPSGQARFLQEAFDLLVSMRGRWRIAGVDWFAWQDVAYADSHCAFCQEAGLFDVAGAPKPAWWAYRHAVERDGGMRKVPS